MHSFRVGPGKDFTEAQKKKYNTRKHENE